YKPKPDTFIPFERAGLRARQAPGAPRVCPVVALGKRGHPPRPRRMSHDSRNLHALPPQVLAIQGALRLVDLSGIHELHVGEARRRAGNLIANQPQTRYAITSSLDPGPKIIVVAIGRNIRE